MKKEKDTKKLGSFPKVKHVVSDRVRISNRCVTAETTQY